MSEADDEVENAAERLYVESPIIMSTVRVVAPFVLTFGLFIMFHGADSAGGGFQGGVIVSTVVLMVAIAFGIEPTRDWVDPATIVAVMGIGVSVFLLIGMGSVALGGRFLEYHAYPVYHASKYGIELVELAIGVIVASVVVGLFFAIAAGVSHGDDAEPTESEGLL
jgi:multicomponent Na+:H+ antiporter subunit B